MPPAVLIGGAVVGGGVLGYLGAQKAADAAEAAGNAQLQAARETISASEKALEKQIAERRRIEERASAAATKSPNEIAAIDRILQTRKKMVDQFEFQIQEDQKLLDAAEPSVKEAGMQLTNLMRGEQAKMLDPVLKTRETQRQKLEANLRRTMGSGFRTTSAGIEALVRFDAATEEMAYGIQEKAVNTALNVYTAGMGTRLQTKAGQQDTYRTLANLDQAVLQAEGNIAGRQTNAVLGAPGVAPVNFEMVPSAYGQKTQVAGAPYAGDIMMGESVAGLGGQLMNVGLTLGGQAYGSSLYSDLLKENKAAAPAPANPYGSLVIGPGVGAGVGAGNGASYGDIVGRR